MSEEIIARHSSPTLAGIKTGSLFNVKFQSEASLHDEISSFNKKLSSKGVIMLPLRVKENTALIYVFRPALLRDSMRNNLARHILRSCGYSDFSLATENRSIIRLISRFKEEGFPHEIGIFLGYPPKDVLGFIENNARNFKLSGIWKVYDNVSEAASTMEAYRRCTDTFLRKINSGNHIDSLTVSI